MPVSERANISAGRATAGARRYQHAPLAAYAPITGIPSVESTEERDTTTHPAEGMYVTCHSAPCHHARHPDDCRMHQSHFPGGTQRLRRRRIRRKRRVLTTVGAI